MKAENGISLLVVRGAPTASLNQPFNIWKILPDMIGCMAGHQPAYYLQHVLYSTAHIVAVIPWQQCEHGNNRTHMVRTENP